MPSDIPSADFSNQLSQRSLPYSHIAVWILSVLIGVCLALTRMPSVFVDGDVYPIGNDGFYHAARILAVAENPTSTHSFDPNLHWPEGLWIAWPWAYDYLGGVMTSVLSSDRLSASKIMVFYPLLWLVANITLLGLIARSALKPQLAAIGVIAYAAAPLTLSLHGLGVMDHHSSEHFWLLLSIYLTGRWLTLPELTRFPIALGVTLAVATAFHNITFLLQLPVIGCLLVARLSGYQVPSINKMVLFGVSLPITQFLVLLPSHHFRVFEYAFYYQSWFHLHIAFLSALAALAISFKQTLNMWICLGISVLLALPAANQMLFGLSFVNSEILMFDVIKETQSPFGGSMSIKGLNYFYSGLIWLLPICFGYSIYQIVLRRAMDMKLALMVFSILCLVLLTTQIRFFNFGYIFLILLPLLMIQQFLPERKEVFTAGALILGAYTFSLSHYLIPPKLGASPRFSNSLPLIKAAQKQCEQKPGLLLADNNWGNFFRYETNCPLLSNNFILSEKELEYIKLTVNLLDQTPQILHKVAPDVQYVFVSRLDDNKLGNQLLSDEVFSGFKILAEMRRRNGEIFGRLYAVTDIPED